MINTYHKKLKNCCSKLQEKVEMMDKRKYTELYKMFVKPFVLEQVICCILLLIHSLTSIAFPYFLKLIIDDAIGKNDMNKLVIYTIAMLVTIVVMIITKYLQSVKFLELGQKIVFKLKQTIIEKLMQYSGSFFRQYQSGEIVSIIENDVKNVEVIATYMISEFLVAIITAVGLYTILFKMNYQIAISSTILVVIYAYLQRKYGEKTKSKSIVLSKSKGELYAQTQELVSNISSVKMLNWEMYFKEKYKIKHWYYFKKERDVVVIKICSGAVGTIFKSLGLILVLCLGGYMVLKGKMTLGILFSLTIYIQRIYLPVISLSNIYIQIKRTQASLKRVFSLIDNDEDIVEDGYIYLDEQLKGNIELKKVSFGYGKDILLKDINMKINKGEKAALIGHNGSGKTTLIRLLLRMQQEYTGEIIFDKYNIKKYKIDYLRQNIICVGQNPFIFNGTILENILIKRKDVSKCVIDEVIEFVCLEEDIKNMPNGLNTIIGEKGVALSGGQAQKIALARIFFMKQQIVILDEPTSALDMKSEKIICENIFNNLKNKTIIAITHREAILRHCSKIYELKNNRVVEKNPFYGATKASSGAS